ncbi:ABC transporter permease [Alteromonas aestuariivivens]|uniref:ABC transporter permease n=1 Tax=Alteromonas aestuariivivens TaxID=1938339 RepID=A0A3D8MDK5_9ALTE|nr:ABC transporter permease [Alteromonas aestuariivivens]RDV28925.1 ABC transporter permease [Alteromonas aestuariivivens]
MKIRDLISFNSQLFARHRWRTGVLTFCIALGVLAVVVLVSLGESARRYVEQEFAMLGSNLLIVLPGKKQTSGGAIPFYGSTNRDLTLEDARRIAELPEVVRVAPIIAGSARASRQSLSRDAMVIGSTNDFVHARKLQFGSGTGLPADADRVYRQDAILGARLAQELFARQNPLGEMITLDGYRFRVVGVLADQGESLGLDLSNIILIPVKASEAVFNTQALFRLLIDISSVTDEQAVIDRIYALIKKRHQGEEDITIITQQAVMSAFNNIMYTLTGVVGLLAAISLLVAGILIMNLSLVSVQQRRQEIGLLKAIGASRRLITRLFVTESLMLVIAASVIGLALAQFLISTLALLVPAVPIYAPLWAHGAAFLVAVMTSMTFSYLPARQAANVAPIEVLQG